MRIHRRGDEDRPVGGEQDGRGKVVGMAARHFRQQIGGRRRDDDEVGLARHPDMADVELVVAAEEVGMDLAAGQRADGKRGDEFPAARVITARTAKPRSRSRRIRSSAL